MKQRYHRHTGQDDPQTIKAVTHIRLEATNAGKLVALDELAQVYLPLCQQYVTLFCADESPISFGYPAFSRPFPNAGTESPSNRWQALRSPSAPTAPKRIA